MTSDKLLMSRIKENIISEYRVMKTVFDWTIVVYLLVPFIMISIGIYRSWWIELPTWIDSVQLSLLFFFVFFFLWRSHFYTYVREADRIFLKKKEKLFIRLKQLGILTSYVYEIIKVALLCFLIAPFWFQHFELDLTQLVLFAGAFVSLKWLIMGVKGRLNVQVRGLMAVVRGIPLFIVAVIIWVIFYNTFINDQIIFLVLLSLFNMFVSFMFVRPRFFSTYTFGQDVAIDEIKKNNRTEQILKLSIYAEDVPTVTQPRRSPRLYSKSNRLFKRRTETNGFLELFIKAVTRNMKYFKEYAQMIGITSAATITLPAMWLKIIVAILGAIFMIFWTSNLWERVFAIHPFTKKYLLKEGFLKARKKVRMVLFIPYIVIVGSSLLFMNLIRKLFLFF